MAPTICNPTTGFIWRIDCSRNAGDISINPKSLPRSALTIQPFRKDEPKNGEGLMSSSGSMRFWCREPWLAIFRSPRWENLAIVVIYFAMVLGVGVEAPEGSRPFIPAGTSGVGASLPQLHSAGGLPPGRASHGTQNSPLTAPAPTPRQTAHRRFVQKPLQPRASQVGSLCARSQFA
jgi:hypothetical protein